MCKINHHGLIGLKCCNLYMTRGTLLLCFRVTFMTKNKGKTLKLLKVQKFHGPRSTHRANWQKYGFHCIGVVPPHGIVHGSA